LVPSAAALWRGCPVLKCFCPCSFKTANSGGRTARLRLHNYIMSIIIVFHGAQQHQTSLADETEVRHGA